MGKFEKPRTNQPQPSKPTAAQKKAAKKAAAPKKPAKAKKPGQGKKIALISAAVVAVLVIGFVGYALTLHNSGAIFKGVHVAGVDVGCMSKDEAVAAVQEAVNATYGTSTLTVKLPDRTLSFEPADTKVSLDVEKAVDEAWEYGRDNGIFGTLKATFSGVSGDHFINIEDSLTLDEDYIRSTIDQVAQEVKSDKTDSTYEILKSESPAPAEGEESETDADGEAAAETVPSELVIHVGTSQRSLDADGLYDAVIAAYMNNDFSAIEYSYEEEPYEQVDLDKLYDELCTDMADAYYDSEKKEIVDEVVGYGFDLTAAKQQQAMAKEGSDLTITLSEVEPEVTRAELEEKLFHDVLAKVDTQHTWNTARTTNLELACKAIDGTILNPGDEFSFNDTVGERTAAKGYQAATVFVSGTSKPELGGGVCQVASSIYYACLQADLNIVYRLEHMYTVDYVPRGMDATVYWGSVDFKFSNSTEYPLRIDASVSDGYVHISLVGTKTTDTTVDLDSRMVSSTQWKDVTEVDETKPADYKEVTVSPYTGYKYYTVKRYLDADGNPISDWEPVQYPNSTYQKRDRVTVIGKQEEEEPVTEPEDPNDTGVVDPGTTTTPDPGTTTTPDPGTTTTPDPGTTTTPDPGTTTTPDPGTTTTPDPGTTGNGNGTGLLE